MRAIGVVALPPARDVKLGVTQREELVLIQTFVAQPTIETLDVTILRRLARLDEQQGDATIGRPRIERTTPEFAAIVEGQTHLLPAHGNRRFQRRNHGGARSTVRDIDRDELAGAAIHHGEAPKAQAVGELITH